MSCRPELTSCRRGWSLLAARAGDKDRPSPTPGGMAMLVLARNVGEEIVIGGDIILTVVSVRGGTVRLGITAPPSVCVDRREVHERRAAFAAGEAGSRLLPD